MIHDLRTLYIDRVALILNDRRRSGGPVHRPAHLLTGYRVQTLCWAHLLKKNVSLMSHDLSCAYYLHYAKIRVCHSWKGSVAVYIYNMRLYYINIFNIVIEKIYNNKGNHMVKVVLLWSMIRQTKQGENFKYSLYSYFLYKMSLILMYQFFRIDDDKYFLYKNKGFIVYDTSSILGTQSHNGIYRLWYYNIWNQIIHQK